MVEFQSTPNLPNEISHLINQIEKLGISWHNAEINTTSYEITNIFAREFNTEDRYALILNLKQYHRPSTENIFELVEYFNSVIDLVENFYAMDVTFYLIVDAVDAPTTSLNIAMMDVANVMKRVAKNGGKSYVAAKDTFILHSVKLLLQKVISGLESTRDMNTVLEKLRDENINI